MVFPEEIKNKLKIFITRRSGLYFKDHDLKSLEEALAVRMPLRGLKSLIAYYTYLTTSEGREDEFRELLNLLTIKHTYFFRNEPHFKALKDKILPELIRRRLPLLSSQTNYGQKPGINIWSAGCSTGEEAYSIAMAVRDLIEDIDAWDIRILATDASEEALRKAETGLYSGSSMRLVDKGHIQKYFTEQIDSTGKKVYGIKESVKKLVNFSFFNLISEAYPTGFDIIFCRNVVIYFESKTTTQVVNKFYSSLADTGCLFMGYSESLQFITDKFQMQSWKEAIFYRKAPGKPVAGIRLEAAAVEADMDKALEEISKAEIDIDAKKIAGSTKMESLLTQAVKLMYLKEHGKALFLIDEASALDEAAVVPHYLAAEVLVNQGKPDKAKTKLTAALSLDSFFAPAYYLFGCIYIEDNMLDEAKENLKKALYIDKDFLLANFYMAYIYKSEDKPKQAIREYRNTLKSLSRYSESDIIAYSGGFNVTALMSVCKDNIERLKDK